MDHFKEDLVFPVLQDYTLPDSIFNPFRKRKTYNNGIVCELDTEFLNHYFHDLEWILGLYAWSKHEFKGHPVEAVVYSRQNNSAILRNLLRILFPEADFIQRDRLFRRKSPRPGQSTIIKIAVATDRSYIVSSEGPNINKMLCQSIGIAKQYFPELLDSVYEAFSITSRAAPVARKDVVVTYIMRQAPRFLEERERLFEMLERDFQVNVNPVYFEELTFEEQVGTVANTDILIGVHGNGLTNLLWLPEHGSAMEIFPKNCHHYDYQIFCEISDRHYVGFNSDDQGSFLFYKGTRHKDAYGDPNSAIRNLDYEVFRREFSSILEDRLNVL